MYIPKNKSELIDLLYAMNGDAPKFKDKTGYLPFRDRNWVFTQLNEGLAATRSKLGEERYETLLRMSNEMRALFEADPDEKTGDTMRGISIIHAMLDVLNPPRASEQKRSDPT
jgi:hypothetical protein